MATIETLEFHLTKLQLAPGDVVIVRTEMEDPADVEQFRLSVAPQLKKLAPNSKFLILGKGFRIEQLTREQVKALLAE